MVPWGVAGGAVADGLAAWDTPSPSSPMASWTSFSTRNICSTMLLFASISSACCGLDPERLTPADDGRRSRLRDQRRRVKTGAQWEDGGASFSRVRRSSRPTRSRCKTA